ncbi:MAG: hypothetical protein ABH875_05555, partial [Candidatus Omnitrophota bacterium]
MTIKTKQTIAVLSVGFVFGVAFSGAGALTLKKAIPFIGKVKHKLEERRIANIPKAKKTLIIADFEDQKDLGKWDFVNTHGELSHEHATSGKGSLKAYYAKGGGVTAIQLKSYFDKPSVLTNWAPYELLSFDVFNPGSAERMILQINDRDGYKVKQNISLKPNSNNTIEVDIRGLWETIKADKIRMFNLFIWNNGSEKVFYIDNLKLLPSAAMGKRGKSLTSKEFLPQKGEDVYKTGDYFSFDEARWRKTDPETGATYIEAPITMRSALQLNVPDLYVCGGIPFGKGQLKELDGVAVKAKSGDPAPFQAKVVSRWPDGSIKWARFDIKSDLLAGRDNEVYLSYGGIAPRQNQAPALKVNETRDMVEVDTGPLKFDISKNGFYLFDNVWLDKDIDGVFSKDELVSAKNDLVIMHKGVEYYSSLDKEYKLTVEEAGPLKAAIKAEGWFVSKRGNKYCKFITRIYAYEGSSYIKVQHTFVYTGYPENKYHHLYKGKRLPKNETIDAVYIKTPINLDRADSLNIGADSALLKVDPANTIEVIQKDHDKYDIAVDNRVIKSGKRLAGWCDISSADWGLSVGVKNLWQQFPKAFTVNMRDGSIVTHLWPKSAGEIDLKTTQAAYGPEAVARGSAFGLAKTHEIAFNFHRGGFIDSGKERVISGLISDIFVTPTPEWIYSTKALGKIAPYDERNKRGEGFLYNIFDWASRQVENFNWYGMIDFGDMLYWYRQSAFDKSYADWGWHPEGRHGWFNNEAFGLHSGALTQYLRTGDRRYLEFGANVARHIMDIDTCHYNTVANDKRLKKRIPDDYSRVGSMHRHNGDH